MSTKGIPRPGIALSFVTLTLSMLGLVARAETLESGEHFIEQTWSQEEAFQRPYLVSVPQTAKGEKLPVLIFLHGNGGNAERSMQGFTRRNPKLAAQYILIFPDGYRKSWNIISERSQADDRGFVESIITKVAPCDNVQKDNFTIMGSSNGAALVNQIAIESQLPNIRNLITGVSPLNTFQHDGTHFLAKGDDNNYRVVAKPVTGRRLMNISGIDDGLVPYEGGPSKGIPAKGGKLPFVHAEESIFLWAKQMGYEGEKLTKPQRVEGNLEIFSYLDGDVIHYKVVDQGHGATGAINEDRLLDFLKAGNR